MAKKKPTEPKEDYVKQEARCMMGANTKIEWCDFTLNPWRGRRLPAGLAAGTRVVASEAMWKEPLKWNKAAETEARFRTIKGIPVERPRVFCASLADVFEYWTGVMSAADGAALHACNECGAWRTMEGMCHGPNAHFALTMDDVRRRLFDLIDATPNLDWLLLTKRPENIARMLPKKADADCDHPRQSCDDVGCCGGIRKNLWLGTSVENQAAADARIPHLLRVPAAVRFLSCEPLLGPVDLSEYLRCESCLSPQTCWCADARVNWVIVGGESGPGARPCRVEWVRSIVEQCKAAGVACFVKQLGAAAVQPHYQDTRPITMIHLPVSLRDKKGGDIAEWPADLRVREFPTHA